MGVGNTQWSALTHRKLVANIAQTTCCRAITLDYPLAPENPFPAALMKARQTYLWLLQRGYSAENIILDEDSSSGWGIGRFSTAPAKTRKR